ncbi:hypothetical protein ACQ4PT_064348 [Festuca glaucescens]
MATAIGAASWLVGKVLNKLSDDLVSAYVASSKLGLNYDLINTNLLYMQGLLHASENKDVSSDHGLHGLLEKLAKKADEAEDALDELHYFIIQDQLDGTREAAPDLGDGLCSYALHCSHAARHTIGNWFPCFCCSRTQDADFATGNPHNVTKSDSGNDGGCVAKLKFDRVAMSNKIKSVIEGIHNLCDPVSDLLNKIPNNSTVVTIKRSPTGSTVSQDKLFGRSVIFEKTVNALTGGTYQTETLSVLPIVGPGGMGKTTFTQHLYNDKRVEGHFTVKVWVCVSTDFDVLKLTRQILSCIPAIEEEKYKCTIETTSLDQLQKSIAERLKSKRFLIVLDDIWKCNSEADWKNLLSPFTKGESKGNMVLVTTRFPSIAQMVETTDPIELGGLEPNDFFTLFEACIFDRSKLPGNYEDDLIDVAKDIARKLKGSPLAANTVELCGSLVFRSVQNLHIEELQITGELFSEVLRSFPALSQLSITKCENLTLVPVEDGGLWDLKMLQSFKGSGCRKLFSGWPMGEIGGGGRAIKPFPTSLRELDIYKEPSMRSMGLLSNLTSLTRLHLTHCRELTMDGFNPLITVNLKKLQVHTMYRDEAGISIAGNLFSKVARSKLMRAGSFDLGG